MKTLAMPPTLADAPLPVPALNVQDYVLDAEALRAIDNLVTDTEEPVDNPISEKERRLLTRALYCSWTPPADGNHPTQKRRFWAAADVGVFKHWTLPPMVPDVFVALDACPPPQPKNKAYFIWVHKKAPEVVVEVVSNRVGNELGSKLAAYAKWGVKYYVVFDPYGELSQEKVQVFELNGRTLRRSASWYLTGVGLGVTLWKGVFEDLEETYLRWCDADGALLLLGEERAVRSDARAEWEARRAAEADARAAAERVRAEQATSERDRMAALLRHHGIEPDQP